MKASARLPVTLGFSRWQYRVNVCSAIFLGIAIAMLTHNIMQMPSIWPSVALGVVAALILAKLAARRSSRPEIESSLIFASAGQVWIGAVNATPAVDAALPELRKMQRYLGLIWLSNADGAQALIWPDSVSPDTHRQMRIWLGIHARSKN